MSIIKKQIEDLLHANGEEIYFCDEKTDKKYKTIKKNHIFNILHDEKTSILAGISFTYGSKKYKVKSYHHDGLLGKIIT